MRSSMSNRGGAIPACPPAGPALPFGGGGASIAASSTASISLSLLGSPDPSPPGLVSVSPVPAEDRSIAEVCTLFLYRGLRGSSHPVSSVAEGGTTAACSWGLACPHGGGPAAVLFPQALTFSEVPGGAAAAPAIVVAATMATMIADIGGVPTWARPEAAREHSSSASTGRSYA